MAIIKNHFYWNLTIFKILSKFFVWLQTISTTWHAVAHGDTKVNLAVNNNNNKINAVVFPLIFAEKETEISVDYKVQALLVTYPQSSQSHHLGFIS